MSEKEFKNLKEGDKIKAIIEICYDVNPTQYIPKDSYGNVVKLTPKKALVYCDFGPLFPETVPVVAFEVDLA